MLPVHVEEYDGVCVVTVKGDFTGDAVAGARRAADECFDSRQMADVVIDLEHSRVVDSQGLEALLWIKRRCDSAAGRFRIAGATEEVRTVLEMTRLNRSLETAHDVASALKAMR